MSKFWTQTEQDKAEELSAAGMTHREIAKEIGFSCSTVCRHLKGKIHVRAPLSNLKIRHIAFIRSLRRQGLTLQGISDTTGHCMLTVRKYTKGMPLHETKKDLQAKNTCAQVTELASYGLSASEITKALRISLSAAYSYLKPKEGKVTELEIKWLKLLREDEQLTYDQLREYTGLSIKIIQKHCRGTKLKAKPDNKQKLSGTKMRLVKDPDKYLAASAADFSY